jgi:uncharacterized protein (TIGR03437 family)
MVRYAALAVFTLFAAQAGTPRRELLGKLPLRFEEFPSTGHVQFIARGPNFNLRLAPGETYLNWTGTSRTSHVRTRLLHSNANARMEPQDQLDGETNYFVGNAGSWRTGITAFGRIRHYDVYPGIDLVFHGEDGRLEYDFVVAPHADASSIQLELSGQRSLRIASNGDLIVSTNAGEIRWKKPDVWQDAGATPVSGRFVIVSRRIVKFELGSYDPERLLVIDPTLSYSTYIGGSNLDGARGIGRDGAGNVYIAGSTNSMDLTSVAAFQPNFGGRTAQNTPQGDGFVAKFSPSGSLLYLTYIGGSQDDYITAMAVDSAGNAYITGATTSRNFPTVNAYQSNFGGTGNVGAIIRTGDAFVAKLSPTGNKLIYSTYLGGSQDDIGMAIAIDGSGNAYVTGATLSANFPVMGSGNNFPYQSGNRGSGGQPNKNCFTCTAPFWDSGDAFVTKLDPTGSQLIFSTFVGGAYDDFADTIAVDSSSNIYIAGCTLSGTYPVTNGAYQTHFKGNTTINPVAYFGDGFVTKMNSTGTALIYSTFIGGSGDDCITAIAIDSTGAVYMTGTSNSTDLPVTTGAPQGTFGGFPYNGIPGTVQQDLGDAFVGKLDPTGSTLVYLTYLGGSRNDGGTAIAVDNSGAAYVAGFTDSTNFPLAGTPLQSKFGGDGGKHYSVNVQGDAFLAIVNPAGTALDFSTYLGGNSDDGIGGILLDGAGNVYVAGGAMSTNFPVTSNAAQSKFAGNGDAFYAVISGFPAAPPVITSITNAFSPTTTIAPNTWIAIKGSGLAQTTRIWGASDFTANVLPSVIDNVSVTFNGNNYGYIYYVSGSQLNVLTPPDLPTGNVQVQVAYNGVVSAPFTVPVQPYSISFFNYASGPAAAPSVVAIHLDGTRIGPPGLISGVTFTPAAPGEEIVVYANGFGPVNPPVVKGAIGQSGTLPSNPALQINGTAVTYYGGTSGFAGIVSPGLYQFNIIVPQNATSGDLTIQAEYGSQISSPVSIRVQK